MTMEIPKDFADEIANVAEKLGVSQKKVREWVGNVCWHAVATSGGVKGIVGREVAVQLDLVPEEE
jgi:uncharacterized protein YjcR